MPISQALKTGPIFIRLLPLCGEGLSWQNFKSTHEFTELLLYKEANTQNIKCEACEENMNRQGLLPAVQEYSPQLCPFWLEEPTVPHLDLGSGTYKLGDLGQMTSPYISSTLKSK